MQSPNGSYLATLESRSHPARVESANGESFHLASVEDAVAAIARGEMLVVVDDPARENEGDLVMAADKVTAEAVNFMATHARGLICVPMKRSRLADLDIPPMVTTNTDPKGTAFHVGVDHRELATTGISALDRAHTIRALASLESLPATFSQPGHVFPLAYQPGGVLRRAGHTEAAVDLATLAGSAPAGVICEIAGADGEMARLPQLIEFAQQHGILILAISDLIAWRRAREQSVKRVIESMLPLDQGLFRLIGYQDRISGHDHVALVLGDVEGKSDLLVRMHSECLTGDAFGSRRCDCGAQLKLSLNMIAQDGAGILVYLRGHEGRGIGLIDKIHAYRLQDMGFDTVQANLALGLPVDRRDYGAGMHILRDLGVDRIRLLTNNPAKRAGLEGYGLTVIDRVPLITNAPPEAATYLSTKAEKMGHIFIDAAL